MLDCTILSIVSFDFCEGILNSYCFLKVVEKSGNAWYNKLIRAVNLPDKSEVVGGEIDMSNYGSCGIDCDSCRFKTEQNCTGCHVHKGQPFWGTCEIYACAASQVLPHCGKCGDFPCEKLIEKIQMEMALKLII